MYVNRKKKSESSRWVLTFEDLNLKEKEKNECGKVKKGFKG